MGTVDAEVPSGSGTNGIANKAAIHRIKQFELRTLDLEAHFDVVQIVGEGRFCKVLLVEPRKARRSNEEERVLKSVPRYCMTISDFFREFHYSHMLGHHKNVVRTFHGAFQDTHSYYFAQEFAQFGDLTSNVGETGIGELPTKRVARQLAAALDFLHTKGVVHRDVKLDNVLVFRSDFSKVKLCDFSESRPSGAVVTKFSEWVPYSPPEVVATPTGSDYVVDPSHDIWQLAILIYLCLTGCLPWQKADSADPRYAEFASWARRRASYKNPKQLKQMTAKARRLFRRMLDARPDKRIRAPELLLKELISSAETGNIKWLSKKPASTDDDWTTSLSLRSFHSSVTEKGRLLFTLSQYGVETNVDRSAKRDRIKEWVATSRIDEEDEEEAGEEDDEPSDEESDEDDSTVKGSDGR